MEEKWFTFILGDLEKAMKNDHNAVKEERHFILI